LQGGWFDFCSISSKYKLYDVFFVRLINFLLFSISDLREIKNIKHNTMKRIYKKKANNKIKLNIKRKQIDLVYY